MKIVLGLVVGISLAYFLPISAVVLQGVAWLLLFMVAYIVWGLRQ